MTLIFFDVHLQAVDGVGSPATRNKRRRGWKFFRLDLINPVQDADWDAAACAEGGGGGGGEALEKRYWGYKQLAPVSPG